MPKFVYFVIVGGLVLAALAVFNITNVNAREETKFIRFSVLAEDQANYGVDKNSSTIPAVSIDIIEDKLHDSGLTSTIPIIKYKFLPSQNPKPAHTDNDGTQAADESEPHNNHENNGSSLNNGSNVPDNNGSSNSNQNNGKQKDTKSNKGNDKNNNGKGTSDKGNGGSSAKSGDNNTADVSGNGKGNSSSQNK